MVRVPRYRTTMVGAALGGVAVLVACSTADPTGAVASVAVTPTAATLRSGTTTQLSATPMDASGNALTGRTVTWTSDDMAVAMVSATGLVTGAGNGMANITATSEGVSSSAAIITSWVGMTGTWSAMIDVGAPGGPCPFTMSITEVADADVTGTGTLDAPCVVATLTLAGTNNTAAVADSVVLDWTGIAGFPFTTEGLFDGTDMYTGAIIPPACPTPCPFNFTRSSFVPTIRVRLMTGHRPSSGGWIPRE